MQLRVLSVAWLTAMSLLSSGCGDHHPQAPVGGRGNAEFVRGPEGTYVLDAGDLAEQQYTQAMKDLQAPRLSPPSSKHTPGTYSRWGTWDEAQRQQATEITRASVNWVWRDGRSSELRLESGGRYTWITRQREEDAPPPEQPLVEEMPEEGIEESAPGVVDLDKRGPPPPAPLPSPPPAKFTVKETHTAGSWKVEGATLTLRIEEVDGRRVPPEEVRTREMSLEDGVIQEGAAFVVLRYRRTPD